MSKNALLQGEIQVGCDAIPIDPECFNQVGGHGLFAELAVHAETAMTHAEELASDVEIHQGRTLLCQQR